MVVELFHVVVRQLSARVVNGSETYQGRQRQDVQACADLGRTRERRPVIAGKLVEQGE